MVGVADGIGIGIIVAGGTGEGTDCALAFAPPMPVTIAPASAAAAMKARMNFAISCLLGSDPYPYGRYMFAFGAFPHADGIETRDRTAGIVRARSANEPGAGASAQPAEEEGAGRCRSSASRTCVHPPGTSLSYSLRGDALVGARTPSLGARGRRSLDDLGEFPS